MTAEKTKPSARIDKWLWSVRLFKTRSKATDACREGQVTVGQLPVKPSHLVSAGEVVEIVRPPNRIKAKVLEPLEQRVGAPQVPRYMEIIEQGRTLHWREEIRGLTQEETKAENRIKPEADDSWED